MEKCYLDSNLLVYFKNEDSPFHLKTCQVIEQLVIASFTLCISPLVLDEFLFQVYYLLKQRRQKKIYNLLLKALQDVLALPGLVLVNIPEQPESQLHAVELMKNYQLRPRDAYHLVTMQKHKIRHFATFDTDFRKVFKAKVLQAVV
ncbi:type II toxin-antitoxin system VapC family toxin [Patescibacteria group bacterium]|nr:type II toxin-antitoxin system VapC family toxin [Patescibacteria group bacterium]